eukprot:CAMPEP_0203902886 /NCGR_PEP_ID=MMETSP0359-20131031/44884_1 /ASSEMBLY_ACC=CAM_ASM_000338 /TAXON_ID=268821 /ORGANISM="Scrippsiella Hangoei, Strain SHTV-5" /LENGTH=593 /DNA_ID=CAMNT_0050826825 /DNA_START=27 /DNA_END=1809 /DNA_ORIENTATION=+
MWHLQELQDSSNLPVAPTPLDGNATLPLWAGGTRDHLCLGAAGLCEHAWARDEAACLAFGRADGDDGGGSEGTCQDTETEEDAEEEEEEKREPDESEAGGYLRPDSRTFAANVGHVVAGSASVGPPGPAAPRLWLAPRSRPRRADGSAARWRCLRPVACGVEIVDPSVATFIKHEFADARASGKRCWDPCAIGAIASSSSSSTALERPLLPAAGGADALGVNEDDEAGVWQQRRVKEEDEKGSPRRTPKGPFGGETWCCIVVSPVKESQAESQQPSQAFLEASMGDAPTPSLHSPAAPPDADDSGLFGDSVGVLPPPPRRRLRGKRTSCVAEGGLVSPKRPRTVTLAADIAPGCPAAGVAATDSGAFGGGSGGSGGLVFACTGVKLTERQQQGLVAVGTLSAECSPQVTHLVAKYLRRTVKLMCAICRGLAIVQPKYLDRCAAGGAASSRRCSRGPGGAPDERPDLLWDKDGEAAFARRLSLPGYALAPALRRARAYGPLLRGRAVRLLGPASCELRAALEAVVAAADGRWLREDSDDLGTPGDVLLLAENRAAAEQVVAAEPSVGRPIYLAEALLAAACSQELRLEPYRLVG